MPAKECQLLNCRGLQLDKTEKFFLNGFICLVDICPLSAVLMLHVCIVRKKGSRRGGSLKIIYPRRIFYSSPRLYFATILWILSLGFNRSLIEESWFRVSMI